MSSEAALSERDDVLAFFGVCHASQRFQDRVHKTGSDSLRPSRGRARHGRHRSQLHAHPDSALYSLALFSAAWQKMDMTIFKAALLTALCALLCQCGGTISGGGPPNMGGPTVEQRNAEIASEPTGDFLYGRRYYVEKTRFWGYLRKPRQPASQAKLVIFREDRKRNPDRLPENGPPGQRYGFDNNYEYRIRGNYTGQTAYDPNSNQFLPVFMLNGYEVVNRNPGWLFSPDDHYNPYTVTLLPR